MPNHKAPYLTSQRTSVILRVPTPLWRRLRVLVESSSYKSANEAVVNAIKAFIEARDGKQ